MLLHFMISFKIDMQNDHVLKKLNLDTLTPSQWSGWGWVGGGGGGMEDMQTKFSLPSCCVS